MVRSNEFVPTRSIDAVVTRPLCGRRTDAQMDFTRTRLPDHFDYFSTCRSTNNRVVDDRDPLVVERRPYRMKLESYSKVSDRLLRFNKSSSYVMRSEQPHLKWDTRGLRKPKGSCDSTIGHGNDYIGFDGTFLRENASK